MEDRSRPCGSLKGDVGEVDLDLVGLRVTLAFRVSMA